MPVGQRLGALQPEPAWDWGRSPSQAVSKLFGLRAQVSSAVANLRASSQVLESPGETLSTDP